MEFGGAGITFNYLSGRAIIFIVEMCDVGQNGVLLILNFNFEVRTFLDFYFLGGERCLSLPLPPSHSLIRRTFLQIHIIITFIVQFFQILISLFHILRIFSHNPLHLILLIRATQWMLDLAAITSIISNDPTSSSSKINLLFLQNYLFSFILWDVIAL